MNVPFDEQLSPHFRLWEFTRSAAATRHGIDIEVTDMTVYKCLQRLCQMLLEPLRAYFGQPITVLSGYRPPEVNRLVGGADTSAHLTGRAADIVIPSVPVIEVCTFFKTSELPFDQVIDEFTQWTHIGMAYRGEMPRQQLLYARKVTGFNGHRRTQYRPGLRSGG